MQVKGREGGGCREQRGQLGDNPNSSQFLWGRVKVCYPLQNGPIAQPSQGGVKSLNKGTMNQLKKQNSFVQLWEIECGGTTNSNVNARRNGGPL